jgi:hypothetical protein
LPRSTETRLRKLEASDSGEIPVWCNDENEVATTINEMIASGEIPECDRARCVYWVNARTGAGAHERALGVIRVNFNRRLNYQPSGIA